MGRDDDQDRQARTRRARAGGDKRGHFRSEAKLIEKALDALDAKAPRLLNLESWKGRSKSSFDELGYAGVDEFIDDIRGR